MLSKIFVNFKRNRHPQKSFFLSPTNWGMNNEKEGLEIMIYRKNVKALGKVRLKLKNSLNI